MRKLLLTAVVLGLVSSFTGAASGQQNPAGANAPRFGVAVVDVSWLFKNYAKFKNTMDGMKTQMESAEASLKTARDEIQQLEGQKQTLKPGAADFNQLDEKLARLKADFNINAGKVRRDFLDREAKVYYETYTEVSKAVNHYARANNIGLVLRFVGDQPDPNQREDVLRAINQPIVFQNSIDITPDVLSLLNPSGQASRPAGTVRQ